MVLWLLGAVVGEGFFSRGEKRRDEKKKKKTTFLQEKSRVVQVRRRTWVHDAATAEFLIEWRNSLTLSTYSILSYTSTGSIEGNLLVIRLEIIPSPPLFLHRKEP